jgi:hypothetical protein
MGFKRLAKTEVKRRQLRGKPAVGSASIDGHGGPPARAARAPSPGGPPSMPLQPLDSDPARKHDHARSVSDAGPGPAGHEAGLDRPALKKIDRHEREGACYY